MTSAGPPSDILDFERSARRDLRVWMLFLVGVGFAITGSIVDPATNCSSDGECAPWLVPIAKWMGIVFGVVGFGQLVTNARRGSRIDRETGDLVWWCNRAGRAGGQGGRIAPADIGLIRISRRSESADDVGLFHRDGTPLPWFSNEVVPWPYERWAERMAQRWPHIRVEVVD